MRGNVPLALLLAIPFVAAGAASADTTSVTGHGTLTWRAAQASCSGTLSLTLAFDDNASAYSLSYAGASGATSGPCASGFANASSTGNPISLRAAGCQQEATREHAGNTFTITFHKSCNGEITPTDVTTVTVGASSIALSVKQRFPDGSEVLVASGMATRP